MYKMLLGMAGGITKKHMYKEVICTGIHKITKCIPFQGSQGHDKFIFDYQWNTLS